jgi:hypothetical protein
MGFVVEDKPAELPCSAVYQIFLTVYGEWYCTMPATEPLTVGLASTMILILLRNWVCHCTIEHDNQPIVTIPQGYKGNYDQRYHWDLYSIYGIM